MALEDGLSDVGARTAEQNGVAVRPRPRDRSSAERASAAALVLDHDRAEERLYPLRPWPANRVVTAARRKRHHQSDGTVGIFGLGERAVRRQRARNQTRKSEREQSSSVHSRRSL